MIFKEEETERKPDTMVQKMTYRRYTHMDVFEKSAKVESDSVLRECGIPTYEEDERK